MEPAADAQSGTSGGGGTARRPDLGDFLEQLNLDDADFDDLVIDEEDHVINESVRWLALERVHTEKSFSQAAFYKDMRAAWNTAQHINKLPDGFCKRSIVESLLKNAGEIMEMRLSGNTRGDYVRIRVRHDIHEPFTKYVSIVTGQKRQVFLVRYEKLARFCSVCGIVGHDLKECGTGVHEEKEKKFGAFLYADGTNKTRSEDVFGRGSEHKRTDYSQEKNKTWKACVDPEVQDTTSSPVKEGQVNMQVDPSVRKRLAMELENSEKGIKINPNSGGVLALTQGLDEDGDEDKSPASSSNSKRARVYSEGVSGDRSVASLKEDHRVQ
ncbi:hypothetical protein VPH35_006432 [Triticum aestivum]